MSSCLVPRGSNHGIIVNAGVTHAMVTGPYETFTEKISKGTAGCASVSPLDWSHLNTSCENWEETADLRKTFSSKSWNQPFLAKNSFPL